MCSSQPPWPPSRFALDHPLVKCRIKTLFSHFSLLGDAKLPVSIRYFNPTSSSKTSFPSLVEFGFFAIRYFSIVVIARTHMLWSSLAHTRDIQEVTMVKLGASMPAHCVVLRLSRPARFGRKTSFSSSLPHYDQFCALPLTSRPMLFSRISRNLWISLTPLRETPHTSGWQAVRQVLWHQTGRTDSFPVMPKMAPFSSRTNADATSADWEPGTQLGREQQAHGRQHARDRAPGDVRLNQRLVWSPRKKLRSRCQRQSTGRISKCLHT